MIRKKPTTRQVYELLGGDTDLLASAHHGLFETPLSGMYARLNLDETIAFATASWNLRNSDQRTAREIGAMPVYEIFRRVNESTQNPHQLRIFQLITSRRRETSPERHDEQNPFGRNLKKRLEETDPETIRKLQEHMREPTLIYVTEQEYFRRKEINGGDNSRLQIEHFMPVRRPSRSRQAEIYAKEIARIIGSYPKEVEENMRTSTAQKLLFE